MSVLNGELANQTTFNTSFMDSEGDTGTVGRVDLVNNLAVSGASVTNVQRNINALASAMGIPTNQVYNYLFTWANTIVGAGTSSFADKIEALVERFHATTGHTHDGTDGNGPAISGLTLTGFNHYWTVVSRLNFTAVSGTTFDVSAGFVLFAPGGGASTEGVLTTAPNNRVSLLSTATETWIEDGEGQRVYGRLTEAAGVWTLSFYTNEAGVETAHNLSSQDITVMFRIVYNSANRPTIAGDPLDPGTMDVTADVVDTFSVNNQNGIDIALSTPTTDVVELTNAGLSSIETIVAPLVTSKFALINKTGASIVLRNESGAIAGDRILTGKGADFTFRNNTTLIICYSANSLRWYIAGGTSGDDVAVIKEEPVGVIDGVNDTFTFSDLAIDASVVWVFVDGIYRTDYAFTPGVTESSIQFLSNIPVVGQVVEVQYFKNLAPIVTPPVSGALVVSGSVASPNTITAAGGINVGADQRQLQFVESSGGAVTVTAMPQIQIGTIVGQELILQGTSDTDYPILNDGNGLALNGAITLMNRKSIYLVWNGVEWSEISRT